MEDFGWRTGQEELDLLGELGSRPWTRIDCSKAVGVEDDEMAGKMVLDYCIWTDLKSDDDEREDATETVEEGERGSWSGSIAE